MKKKTEALRELLATIFMSINKAQQAKGTGLSFKYKNTPFKLEDGTEGWGLDLIVMEAGHGQRTLQAFPFKKQNGMDRYSMEYEVLMSVLCILTENTLLQYNEMGKLLNSDMHLQEKAKKEITKKVITE